MWMSCALSKLKRLLEAVNKMIIALRDALCLSVLNIFKSLNHKIGSKLTVWYMKEETAEHFNFFVKVFKWVILPASVLYVSVSFFLLGKNTFSSMLWGLLIFFYSSFLPDLPAIYRRKRKDRTDDLKGYKKYALLLFAPVLIWLLFSGIQLNWKTTETFHNLKSLAIYVAFLLLCSFFTFGDLPISTGNVAEILSLPFYGLAGYLTHLKVDEIW